MRSVVWRGAVRDYLWWAVKSAELVSDASSWSEEAGTCILLREQSVVKNPLRVDEKVKDVERREVRLEQKKSRSDAR